MVYHLYLQGYYNIDLLGPIWGVYTDEPMYMVWCGLWFSCSVFTNGTQIEEFDLTFTL